MRQREHSQSRAWKGRCDWYYFSIPSWAGPQACARAHTRTHARAHTRTPFSLSLAETGVRINNIKTLLSWKGMGEKVTLLHAVKGSLS